MKKIAQYLPLRMCVLLVLGVLLGNFISIPNNIVYTALSVCFLLLISFFFISKTYFSFRWVFQFASYVIIILLGIIRINSEDISQQKTHYSQYISSKNSLVIQVDKTLKPSKYHDKYYAGLVEINNKKCKGKILINIHKDSLTQKLPIGDLYFATSSLLPINKPLNPYTFDYNKYLQKQGVFHQISIKNEALLALDFQNNNLKTIAARLRTKIQKSLEKHSFKKNELGIINALVLGQRQSISKDLLNSYAGAGAIHILAVSGLHVGILFLILGFLLKPLEKITHGKHLKTVLIVLFLWGFAFLTGLSGSVVRAVSMFTFIAVGMTIKNKKSGVFHALITSFFFLVMIHPMYIYDVGFQMSYAAVLGIILFFPKINSLLPRIKFLFSRKIWELLCVSLSATIGTLPISLYYFHQFPGLFFLSNIVIVPFLGLIMGFGILVVVLSLLHILPELLVHVYSSILSFMNAFIGWIASQEQFLLKDIPFSLLTLMATYILIAMGFRWLLERKITRFQTFLLSILLLQSIFLYEKHHTLNKNELVVFHKTKESIIGIKRARNLQVFHSLDSNSVKKIPFIRNYKVSTRLDYLVFENKLPNVLEFEKKKILIIDSLGIYQNISFKPDIILLRQSPKINLERLIQNHQPKMLIADGSNYKSYVKQWRNTCLENNTRLHYTGNNGAFIKELKN